MPRSTGELCSMPSTDGDDKGCGEAGGPYAERRLGANNRRSEERSGGKMSRVRIHTRKSKKKGATYSITVGDNPSRTIASGLTSRKEAEKIARDTRRVVDVEEQLRPASHSTITVGRAIDLYLAARVDKSSYESMEQRTRLHLRPTFEHMPLSQLTVGKVELFLADLARRRAPQTVKHVRAHLSGAISQAVRAEQWGGANVAALAKMPVDLPRPGQNDWLRPFEWLPFLDAVPDRWRAFYALSLTTGMRLGEVAGAHRTDVDLKMRKIHVRRSWERPTTKNGHSRWVPLSDLAMPHVQAAVATAGGSTYLFPLGEDGGMAPKKTKWSMLTRSAANRAGFNVGCRLICRRKGCGYQRSEAEVPPSPLPDCPLCSFRLWASVKPRALRFHDLRHSFASSLAMAGVDYLTIAKLIGDDAEQVRVRYAHHTPEHFESAVAAAAALVV